MGRFWKSLQKLAHLEGETSNQLFDALADWEEQLEALEIDFEGLEP